MLEYFKKLSIENIESQQDIKLNKQDKIKESIEMY